MKYFTFLNITLFHNTAYMYEYVYSNPPQHTQIVVPGFTLSSESKWELKKKPQDHTCPHLGAVFHFLEGTSRGEQNVSP